MYRMFIIDDERIGQSEIQTLLKQAGMDLELYEVCNERDVLTFFEQHKKNLFDEQILLNNRDLTTDHLIKEYILNELVNGMKVEYVRNKVNEHFNENEINRYQRMMLLEGNGDLFGDIEKDLKELFENSSKVEYIYLNLNEQQSVLFLMEDKELDYKKMAEQVVAIVEKKYNKKCFVALSDMMKCPVQEIGAKVNLLKECMRNKFYQTEYRIFLESARQDADQSACTDDDALMKKMKQDIKMKDISSLRQHFQLMCEKYRSGNAFSQVYVKFIFSNLLKDVYENFENAKEQTLYQELEELYSSKEFTTVIDIVSRNIDCLEQEFEHQPQVIHKEIESVKKYIYENYDKEISVDYLADMVYMAPSYLSHVFKKETGQNLSKFIKAYRMEKARELLEETHNKIVNISYAVGYPNVSYFCQSFREYFGVSPQRYRNQGDRGLMHKKNSDN